MSGKGSLERTPGLTTWAWGGGVAPQSVLLAEPTATLARFADRAVFYGSDEFAGAEIFGDRTETGLHSTTQFYYPRANDWAPEASRAEICLAMVICNNMFETERWKLSSTTRSPTPPKIFSRSNLTA